MTESAFLESSGSADIGRHENQTQAHPRSQKQYYTGLAEPLYFAGRLQADVAYEEARPGSRWYLSGCTTIPWLL